MNTKHCPFCGNIKPTIEKATSTRNIVTCWTCGAMAGEETWNERASLWQPIETAPKGTIILWSCDSRDMNIEEYDNDPAWSHWQPLPEPPNA